METFAIGNTGKQLVDRLNANFLAISARMDDVINVKEYGALGDGVTDDAAVFQTVIDLAQTTNKPIVIPAGHYIFLSTISNKSFTEDNTVCIIGFGNPILDFSGAVAGGALISIWGTTGESDTVSASLVKGDINIPMTNTNLTTTLNRHDIVKVLSDQRYVSEGTYQFFGELCRVQDITDQTINLYGPLYDNYSTDGYTVTVQKIRAPKVILRDFTIIGNLATAGGDHGLNTRYTREIDYRNLTVKNVMYSGIYQEETFGGCIDNCTIGESSLAGFGYGIANGPSYHLTIQNCNVYSCRHCIESGGNYPTHNLIMRNNHLFSEKDDKAAIDNHTGVEDCLIEGNFCHGGGIYLRGINTMAINNTVFAAKDGEYGIWIQDYGYYAHQPDHYILRGNKIYGMPAAPGNYGIMLSLNADDTINYLEISDNKIDAYYSGININDSNAACTINTLVLRDNYIKKDGGSSAAVIVYPTYISIGKLEIRGNSIISTAAGILIDGATHGDIIAQNNNIKSKDRPFEIVNTTGNALLSSNMLESTDGDALQFANITELILFNNVFKGMDDEGLVIADTVTTFTWDGNRRISCSGSISNAAGTTNTGTNW